MGKINFVCPECEGTILVAHQQVWEVVDIEESEGDDVLIFGEVLEGDVTEVGFYQCHTCGFKLGTEDEENTIAWLRLRGMIEDDPPKQGDAGTT